MSMKGNYRDIFNGYECLHPGARHMLKRLFKAMPPDARRPMLDVLLKLVQRESADRSKRKP